MGAMDYTKEAPSKEGWYWLKFETGHETVKKVFKGDNGAMMVKAKGPTGDAVIMDVKRFKTSKWAGPAYVPEPRDVRWDTGPADPVGDILALKKSVKESRGYLPEQGPPHYRVVKTIGKSLAIIEVSNKLTLDEATTMAFNENGHAAADTTYSAAVMSLAEINKLEELKNAKS
jgi:hypothetical protein